MHIATGVHSRAPSCTASCQVTSRFDAAVRSFDAASALDPVREQTPDGPVPRALLHAQRCTAWIRRLEAEPSEPLLLAARCQHLRRWEIDRGSFPDGRTGYLAWREHAARFHARAAAEILVAVGYEPSVIEAVRRINLKRGRALHPDVQTMEDALCLTFLEHELGPFVATRGPDKTVSILSKTWAKMSPRARELALALDLPPGLRALVEQALRAPRD